GHAAVDVLDLGDGDAVGLLDVEELALGADDVFLDLFEALGVGLLLLDDAGDPLFVGLVAREQLDEVRARHFAAAHAQGHDVALLAADLFEDVADFGDHRVELARGEFQVLEQLPQFLEVFLGGGAVAAVAGEGALGLVVLLAQGFEALAGLFQVEAVLVLVGVLLVGFLGGRCRGGALLHGGGHVLHGVQVAADDVAELALAGGHQVVFGDDVVHRLGPFGKARHQLADALLDALGYLDFPFPGQQFHGAHFAHVHAHRVGGAVLFGLHGGEGGGGLGGGDLVGGGIAGGHQQGVRVRGGLEDADAHVVDHLDDVFHLIGIGDVLRQVVVHLRIGQVTLFTTFGDKFLETGLLLGRFAHNSPVVGVGPKINAGL